MPTPRSHRYRIVDVFTLLPLEGNPLAVFPDGSALDDITMQNVARELNLSETVFILPATQTGCAASLRIFTPSRELQFAGHPTVGASFILLDEKMVAGDSDRFVLQEKIGPVPIQIEAGDRPLIWLTTPPISDGPTFSRESCAKALGLKVEELLDIDPQILSAGNPALFVPLRAREAVDRAGLSMSDLLGLKGSHLDAFCVFLFSPTPAGAYSRMFAPEYGIIEDPATGSATGPLAAYMMKHGLAPSADGTRFLSEQGTKMRRRSLLHVHIHGNSGVDGIAIGGYVTPLVDAVMNL